MIKCKSLLESESNLFWVAFQSNVLADVSNVEDDFKKSFEELKEELSKKGWILPSLSVNMRNQSNITKVTFDKGTSTLDMNSSINVLPSATSTVGEVPLLFKMKYNDWDD